MVAAASRSHMLYQFGATRTIGPSGVKYLDPELQAVLTMFAMQLDVLLLKVAFVDGFHIPKSSESSQERPRDRAKGILNSAIKEICNGNEHTSKQ